MSEQSNEIEALLRQAQGAEPVVREFVSVWLEKFRRDTQEILEYQRREGRALAFQGLDSEPVRQETEERLAAARERLRGRLVRLMTWAKDSGRLAAEYAEDPVNEPPGEAPPEESQGRRPHTSTPFVRSRGRAQQWAATMGVVAISKSGSTTCVIHARSNEDQIVLYTFL